MSELFETAANLPQSLNRFKVLALYKFADFKDCAALKPELALFCCARGIRGTFILAPEGINGTVAGSPAAIEASSIRFASQTFAKAGFVNAEPQSSEVSSETCRTHWSSVRW